MLKIFKILVLLILGVLAAAGVAASISNSKEEAREQRQHEPSAQHFAAEKRREPSAPTIRDVTASDLADAYAQNEIAADQVYRDKVWRIHGTVLAIRKDLVSDQPVLELHSSQAFRNVRVEFPDGQNLAALAALRPEDAVVLRGRVTGLMMDVQVKDAVLEIVPKR